MIHPNPLGKWTSEDTPSEYFHSWAGQLEYCLVHICLQTMQQYTRYWPWYWFGAQNSLALYLIHPSYSPFVDHPHLGNPKMFLDWDKRNVPEGQEHFVDENFLPRNKPWEKDYK